jgi:signal transduction histidine kinase
VDAPDPLPRGGDDDPLIVALQRRLNRLRFDLHDGPQQEVHLLAQDLRLFRRQLGPMIDGHPDRDRALGRLDDLDAQLVALDADLRRLSTAARSPLLEESLADGLAQLAEAFHRRTGIVPRTEVSGSVDELTDSQQIAVLSIVRESLSNIRRHSEADNVEIAIAAGEESIVVEVRDDGSGFAPEVEAPAAARSGHLGLVGMRERTEMLGGRTEIDSVPGGPTVVSASLPRWPAEPA